MRKKVVESALVLLLINTMFFAGCAGRTADPVTIVQPDDTKLDCMGLKLEIAKLQANMQKLLLNTEEAISDVLWTKEAAFFMDLEDAKKIEFGAMRQRHNRLLVYAAEKGCDMAGVTVERIPSVEERKKAAKNKE